MVKLGGSLGQRRLGTNAPPTTMGAKRVIKNRKKEIKIEKIKLKNKIKNKKEGKKRNPALGGKWQVATQLSTVLCSTVK